MEKLAFAVAMVAGAVASVFADGEEPAKDLVWTINEPTVSNKTITTMYNKVNVNADFKLDGANLTNVFSGATVTIGENAAAPVVVTVTNANGRAWETYQNATLNIKGKGGRIDLHGVAAPYVGWGNAVDPWISWIGYNYWGNGGTIGRQLKVYFNVDSSVVPADGIVDVAHLYPNGFLGMGEFHNNTPGSIARILFDGGRVYAGHSSGSTWFQPDANTEIRLESVNGNPIYIWFNYTHNAKLTNADGTSSKGKLSTVGDADLLFGTGNSTVPIIQLCGTVAWGHSGDTYFIGQTHFKLIDDDFLPHGSGAGDVYVMKYCKKYVEGDGGNNAYICWLDCNGTTQKVNSIYAYQDTNVKGHTYVTNTAAKRATILVGELQSEAVVKGTFGGPVDVRMKGERNTFFESEFADGAHLYLDRGEIRLPDNTWLDPSVYTVADEARLFVSNGLFETFATLGSKTTVEGWRWNTYDWDKPTTGADGEKRSGTPIPSSQSDANKRDLPPTFFWDFDVSAGNKVDVTRGVLVTSNLTAAAGAKLSVASNAAIRVQTRTTRGERFLRFTFKEAVTKSFFALQKISLIDENCATYYPVDKGYERNATATSAAQLGKGEYMLSPGWFNGSSAELPAQFPANSAYRNSYYSYDDTRFLMSDSNSYKGLLYVDSKPNRNDETTWKTVTLRLTDDAPALCGYRFCTMGWNIESMPNCWCVEVSQNGVDWTLVDERTDYYCFAYANQQSGKFPYAEGYGWFNSNPLKGSTTTAYNKEGMIFRWTKNVDSSSVSLDFGGATVRVDRGGLIDAAQTDGTSAIAALEVAVATGAGTFRNVTFAEVGTINVVAAGDLKGKTVLPMTLENCTGAANLVNWSVKINGEANSAATVEWADGSLTLHMNRGLRVIVR